jgi:acyl-CoA thioester hydrolase
MAVPAQRPGRDAFAHFADITTRWSDNDVYRHVNNVAYYSFFDTAVNRYLIERGVLDIERSPVVGWVVETQCRYYAPIAFPDRVSVGVGVTRLGTSSVRYRLGVFRNDEQEAAAEGVFVHVYVDRATNRPTPLPDAVRAVLSPLLREAR